MGIPFWKQYDVEFDRNTSYQWLSYGINVIALVLYGVLFKWIPTFLRHKRSSYSNKFSLYFKFVGLWECLNGVIKVKYPFFNHYAFIQPSLFILYGSYLAINGVFCYIHTEDLDYLPRKYIVAKRISRIAIANLPLIYILVIKNDLVTSITGLKHDRLVLLHKWVARTMFAMICVHIGLACDYWLGLGFPVMLVIPPQIFGYIAFSSFGLLNFGSVCFIRRWAYDFFLVQHRVLSFIMLLFTFFHNRKGTEGAVILAVHQLVIDRILSRILSFVHARMSPTKGKSTFEVLDDSTLLVTVRIKAFPFKNRKWYLFFLPKVNTWKPGQHVYLTVGKISGFQQHPFTIASLSELGEMKFVIRVQKGFTKKLMNKIVYIQEQQALGNDISKELDETFFLKKIYRKIVQKYRSRNGASRGIELDDLTSSETNRSASPSLNEISSNENTEASKSKSPEHSLDSNSSFNSVNVATELLGSSRKQNRKNSNTNTSSTRDSIVDLERNDDSPEPLFKATFVGPVGAHYQPLITFDGALFLSAGSGASFTFPVCLALLKDIQERNELQDYINRNPNPLIKLVWVIRKTENIKWYKFILDDLVEFCNNDMLQLDIFVTQKSDIKEGDFERENSEKIAVETRRLDTSESSSSSSNPPPYSITVDATTKSESPEHQTTEVSSIASSQSLSIFEARNVKFHSYRPDVKSIITQHVDPLKNNKHYKSLAVLCCGPDSFTHSVKSNCNKLRWVSEAPDIYCYTESFG